MFIHIFYGGNILQQKISYEIVSERGKLHEKLGMENEDAINVVTNGDYIFAILSDGAGSSKFAKESAQTTVKAVSDFCYNNSTDFFKSTEITAKKMIFDVQADLDKRATEIGTTLSEMMSTLMVLALDKSTMRYVTIHIGDGLIALRNENWKIISYPENGPTKQYTYFTNSKNVFKHLRINEGECKNVKEFIVSSDGLFEDCYSSNQMTKRLSFLSCNSFSDDTTYCKVFFNMVQ